MGGNEGCVSLNVYRGKKREKAGVSPRIPRVNPRHKSENMLLGPKYEKKMKDSLSSQRKGVYRQGRAQKESQVRQSSTYIRGKLWEGEAKKRSLSTRTDQE